MFISSSYPEAIWALSQSIDVYRELGEPAKVGQLTTQIVVAALATGQADKADELLSISAGFAWNCPYKIIARLQHARLHADGGSAVVSAADQRLPRRRREALEANHPIATCARNGQ